MLKPVLNPVSDRLNLPCDHMESIYPISLNLAIGISNMNTIITLFLFAALLLFIAPSAALLVSASDDSATQQDRAILNEFHVIYGCVPSFRSYQRQSYVSI